MAMSSKPMTPKEPGRPAVGGDQPKRVISEAEKATRRDRVAKAKDALARSAGAKGDHVVRGRAALKVYLQNLNELKQPDDAQFEALIAAPFTAPPKKRTTGNRF